jgi:hypothetical protein
MEIFMNKLCSPLSADSSDVRLVSEHPFGMGDYVLAWIIVFLAMAAAYHPYFFGDEINALREIGAPGSFLKSLAISSEYKPRLLFNSIWVIGGMHEWPRWGFAAINAFCMGGIGALTARIASRYLAATRLQIWMLLGSTVLLSRFGVMIYFDYVSGIIETMSLFLFLCAVVLSIEGARRKASGFVCLAVVAATAAVLVHERYMAATFAFSCVFAGYAVVCGRRNRPAWMFPMIAAMAVIPPATFILLTKYFGSLPISTGTSATEVALNLGTVKVFFTYLANVFLGMNFGKDWFVGSLNMGSRAGFRWSLAFAAAFLPAWAIYLRSVGRDRGRWLMIFALLAVIGALVVMASLPGEGRQEARWIYPVGVFVGLLFLCAPSAVPRYLLLGLAAVLSALHWGSGALMTTANVYESRSARNLAVGVNNLIPTGRNAVLMGIEGADWMVGHSQGAAYFARRNFIIPLSLRVHESTDSSILSWADVGLLRVGSDDRGAALFSPIYGTPLKLMLDPQQIERYRGATGSPAFLGQGRAWEGWVWSRAPKLGDDGLVLEAPTHFAAFTSVPAHQLDMQTLTYRARLLEPGSPSKMRLQVNWMDEKDRFIDATIQVVDVGKDVRDYSMQVIAPPHARGGLVYANLHDGETKAVLLESVRIQQQTVLDLGGPEGWRDWRWSGTPKASEAGVVLGPPEKVAGFRELDATQLDNRILVYRARTLRANSIANMRLQINWMDAHGRFLRAVIQVVNVGQTLSDYPLLAVAPKGAAKALVYANLHDGERTEVLLQSVSIVALDKL